MRTTGCPSKVGRADSSADTATVTASGSQDARAQVTAPTPATPSRTSTTSRAGRTPTRTASDGTSAAVMTSRAPASRRTRAAQLVVALSKPGRTTAGSVTKNSADSARSDNAWTSSRVDNDG